MKTKTLLLILFHVIAFSSFAQWVTSYNGIDNANEDAKSAVLTDEHGYAVCGRSDSAFKKRALLYKYDGFGTLSWTKIFNTPYSCEAFSVVQTNDSCLVILGYANTGSALANFEIFMAKVKLDGTVIYQKIIGNNSSDETAYAADMCPDGGIIVAVQTNKNPGSAIDLMLVKISSSGNILWTKDIIDTYFAEVPVAVKCDAYGNILLTGYMIPAITSNPMFYDMFLIKCDLTGNLIWAKRLGGTKFDQANNLAILNNDSGYAICGRTESYGSGGGSTSAYLTVLDTGGYEKWSRTFSLPTFQLIEFFGVAADSLNNIFACGFIQNYNNNNPSLLVKYDASGNVLWNTIYDDSTNRNSVMNSIINKYDLTLPFQQFLMCGRSDRFNSSDNIEVKIIAEFGVSCGDPSNSLSAYVVDSGLAVNLWNINDSIAIPIADHGSYGQNYSAGNTYSQCNLVIGSDEIYDSFEMELFPNPAHSSFEIRVSDQTMLDATIAIYDVFGEKLKTLKIDQTQKSITINSTYLPAGIYLIQLSNSNGRQYTRTLVIN
ncbi:MAG: T9SS type A sorting domain-containing protein [Bacteroidetes bacterium]|nr:T9SS type A sorting domain-containing protein [Bacteroidota bacterium]